MSLSQNVARERTGLVEIVWIELTETCSNLRPSTSCLQHQRRDGGAAREVGGGVKAAIAHMSPEGDSRIGSYGISQTDASKFHEVFCDQHLAGKVLLNLFSKGNVIIIKVGQHDGLDIGARGPCSDFVR